MAALRNAVSPDFTYSQSYLSLLSSTGCMTGVICCASPAIRAMIQRVRQDMAMRWRPNPDFQVGTSAPTAVNNGGLWTLFVQENGEDHRDLEKGSDPGADTEGDEQHPTHDAVSGSECKITPPGDKVNDAAVALVDSGRFRENELPVEQDQLF